ncbi:hypothetical protein KSB_57870 [Ktedonobacter robiniae]|uniref:Uncharacterized protein n=1 Tax=Ktedonobacter robiniae TaxID=2778365 RepID=A0ABQ3UY77_9CHLR|nr:hypothetical protein KSB_57870 [Ktedonobacter robiniae]
MGKPASASLLNLNSWYVQAVGRKIHEIKVAICVSFAVRVITGPERNGCEIVGGEVLLNLKPPKDNMEVGSSTDIPILSRSIRY